MDGLFPHASTKEAIATGLGRSSFIRRSVSVEQLDELLRVGGPRREVRETLRQRCPRLPGVYGMVDEQGELIYVGMSGRLRDRLLTYFTKGPPEAKEQRVSARAQRLMWEVGEHELAVRLRELELIRRWRPRFNSLGHPGRREIGFIYMTGTDAPSFRFGRRPPQTSQQCWGPIPLTRRTRIAVERLNHLFLLRDCPDRAPVRFADQPSILPDACHPDCLRGDVGTCLAPCAGDRSRADYWKGVACARSFLDGGDHSLIEQYEASMRRAAAERSFERAATYRDIWESLNALWEQLELVRSARWNFTGVHVLPGCSGKESWAAIAGGKVAVICQRPSSKRAARQVVRQLEEAFSGGIEVGPEDYEQLRIVASWYRKYPATPDSVMDPQQAIELCYQRIG